MRGGRFALALLATLLLAGCDNGKERTFQGWVEAELIFVGPDESGRDQQLRKAGECVVGEFAAFHRQREPRAYDRQHARDDLAIVDLGELGKPRPLGDDQPDHVLAARAVDFVHEHVDDHVDQGANGQIAQRRRLDGVHQRAQHRAHEFLE